jgi:hypothetical protein
MDMSSASNQKGNLPGSFLHSIHASSAEEVSQDSNWPSLIHALLASGSFVLLMPVGVVFLRVQPRSVRWHWLNQCLSLIIMVLGTGMGIYLSPMFEKSSAYHSAHQILGFTIAVLALGQFGLGYWHHLLYKRCQKPTKFGLVHRHLGRFVILVAIINGGIGLDFAHASSRFLIAYAVVTVAILLPLIVTVIWRAWRPSKASKNPSDEAFERLRTEYPLDAYHSNDTQLSNLRETEVAT